MVGVVIEPNMGNPAMYEYQNREPANAGVRNLRMRVGCGEEIVCSEKGDNNRSFILTDCQLSHGSKISYLWRAYQSGSLSTVTFWYIK